MCLIVSPPSAPKSPFSRGRGLKLHIIIKIIYNQRSPFSRGRGLKSDVKSAFYVLNYVALFTRAWIEIKYFVLRHIPYQVALFTRAWIEIQTATRVFYRGIVALFTRAWIEILPDL